MKKGFYDICNGLYSSVVPINIFSLRKNIQLVFDGVNINQILNIIFWIFIGYSIGFFFYSKVFQFFIWRTKIKYRRKQLARSLWDLSFFGASTIFLILYHMYMISPGTGNKFGLFFRKHEESIFYETQPSQRFQPYSLLIITFYLHSAMLDFRENDLFETTTKLIYVTSQVVIIGHRLENLFILLSTNLGIYKILSEIIFLLAASSSKRCTNLYKTLLALKLIIWLSFFLNVFPFQYLIPIFYGKEDNLLLKFLLLSWYIICIWDSPPLHFVYHYFYHSNLLDCIGDGSACRCILLKDSLEQKHFKALRKAYLEVKLAYRKEMRNNHSYKDDLSTTYQALKCALTLKRKLKRIREAKLASTSNESELLTPTKSPDL